MQSPRPPLARLALVPVVALAFGLRVYLLPDASVWYDEGLSVWAARGRLIDMVHWTSADVHPPLYFAFLHYWIRFAGDSELAVRFPSVIFGTLTAAALWKLGRILVPKQPWVATSGALLFALARFSVWWSQETRMYELAALLCVLNLICAVELRRGFRPVPAVGYVLTTLAGLWTLYLLAFLLPIDGIYWLAGLAEIPTWNRRWRAVSAWTGLMALPVVGLAPWLAYALPRMHHWADAVPFGVDQYLKLYATLLALGISTDLDAVLWPVLAVVGLVALGLVALVRSRREVPSSLLLLFLVVALPPAGLWILVVLPRSIGYVPDYRARYLLPYASAFYLLAAWAIVSLADVAGRFRRPIALALAVGLVGAQVWSLEDYYAGRFRDDDYVSVASALHAWVQPGDLVVMDTDDSWPVFAYHWGRPFVGVPDGQKQDPANVERFLTPRWQSADAVWLVVNERALNADPQRLVEGWLTEHAAATRSWRFGVRRLVVFARTPARAATLGAVVPDYQPLPPAQPLANGSVTLVGWEQPLWRITAGQVANVAVDLQGTGTASRLSVSLGQPAVARADVVVPPTTGPVHLPISLLVPPTVPGGSYGWYASLGPVTSRVGQVDVVGESAPATPGAPVAPSVPANATFGAPPLARLLGYDNQLLGAASGVDQVTLYWQADGAAPLSYKVFVHLLSSSGRVAAQIDDFPLGGQRPTTSWRPGEVLVDRYDVPLPPGLPAGRYTLEVGFYDPTTGARLGPVSTGTGMIEPDDRVVLGEVQIR